MSQRVIGTIPPGGFGGAGAPPPNVSTPFLPGSAKSEVKTKSFFKSVETSQAD